MTSSRDALRARLDEFEVDMRLLAESSVTTGKFLEIFLVDAKAIAADASADDQRWVSGRLTDILAKYQRKDG